MQVVSSATVNRLLSRCLDFAALGLALALAGAGWKKQVVRVNAGRMRISVGRFFHLRLCFQASRDLLDLLLAHSPPVFRISPRDRKKFATLSRTGGILLSAHFHNWERMGNWLGKQGMPLLALSKDFASPFWNRILQRLRGRAGISTTSQSPVRQMMRWLKTNGVFGILLDQHVEGGQIERFFGIPVQVSPILKAAQGYPIYLFLQLPPDRIRVFCLSGEISDPSQCLRRYHRILELAIRKHPEYWYGFFHRRFKYPDIGIYRHVSRETSPQPSSPTSCSYDG